MKTVKALISELPIILITVVLCVVMVFIPNIREYNRLCDENRLNALNELRSYGTQYSGVVLKTHSMAVYRGFDTYQRDVLLSTGEIVELRNVPRYGKCNEGDSVTVYYVPEPIVLPKELTITLGLDSGVIYDYYLIEDSE